MGGGPISLWGPLYPPPPALQLVPGGDWEAALHRAETAGLHGDWETPQRAGFCFLRATLVAVRYVLLRRCGWPASRVKTLLAAVRAEYVAEAARALGRLAAALEEAASQGRGSGSVQVREGVAGTMMMRGQSEGTAKT